MKRAEYHEKEIKGQKFSIIARKVQPENEKQRFKSLINDIRYYRYETVIIIKREE